MNQTKKTTKRRELTDLEKVKKVKARYYNAIEQRQKLIELDTEEENEEAYQDLLDNGTAFDKALAYYMDIEAQTQGDEMRYTEAQQDSMMMNLPDEQRKQVLTYERFYQILVLYGAFLSEYAESYSARRAEYFGLIDKFRAFQWYSCELYKRLYNEGSEEPLEFIDPNYMGKFKADFNVRNPENPEWRYAEIRYDTYKLKRLEILARDMVDLFHQYYGFREWLVRLMVKTYTSPLWWIMPRRVASFVFDTNFDLTEDLLDPLKPLKSGGDKDFEKVEKAVELCMSNSRLTPSKAIQLSRNYYNAIIKWRGLTEEDIVSLCNFVKHERTGRQ